MREIAGAQYDNGFEWFSIKIVILPQAQYDIA